MQQFFSRSPSPEPPQEDEDGIIPYDEDTYVLNYMNLQNATGYYNDTAATATDTAAANNDWWFNQQNEQLGLVNQEEELNSDDDDDEINSYFSFDNTLAPDDTSSFARVLASANGLDQPQQQVPAIPSSAIAYTPDLAPFVDDNSVGSTAGNNNNNSNTIDPSPVIAYTPDLATVTANNSFDLTESNSNAIEPSPAADYNTNSTTVTADDSSDLTGIDNNANDQQLVASATDANNTQDSTSAFLSWLANRDPKDLSAADIEHILLTQTSELLSGNPADADDNSSSGPTSNVANTDDIQAANNNQSLVETTEAATEEVAHETPYDHVPVGESTHEIRLHGDVSQEKTTGEMLQGDVSGGVATSEMLYGDIPSEEIKSSVLYGGVPLEGSTHEILPDDVSRERSRDEIPSNGVSLEEIANSILCGDVPTMEEILSGDVYRKVATDEMLPGDVPHEELTEEENSSPESCTSPPFQLRTATLNKEEDNQVWTNISSIDNYDLSAPTQYPLPVTTQYPSPVSTQYQSPASTQYQLFARSQQEYAAVVQSLQISSTLGKRKLEDEHDSPIPNKKHQRKSLVNN